MRSIFDVCGIQYNRGSKKLLLALETGHALTNEQTERMNKWIENFLKNGKIE